jgi:hypothetical protein
MKLLRTAAVGAAFILGPVMGEAVAHTGNAYSTWVPHHQHGYPAMMGHCPGGMHGYGHGMPGRGHGSMMAPGYGSSTGPGNMGMHGNPSLDPGKLGDEELDRMGERIAERHRSMQEIAAEQDPAARRELVRKHLAARHAHRGPGSRHADKKRDHQGGGMTMPGMTGQGSGMMGQGSGMMGMMAPGTMRGGAMAGGELSDEQLDRMAEHMIGQHARMQQLAETDDPEVRRDLLREHFESMQEFMGGMHRNQ